MAALGALVEAALLGVVEGVTEYLPVSSTGHLIVAGEALGLTGEKVATFEIFIQAGAILAVVWEWRRMLSTRNRETLRTGALLLLAFLPAAVLGLLLHGFIKEHLFSSRVVAWSLLVGALAILVIETARPRVRFEALADIGWRHALLIGCAQCLALVPGTSRSAATILGAMVIGLSRPAATEFSFLLAIPTLGAAVAYDLLKSRHVLAMADAPFFAVGFVVSFVTALVVVKWLIGYVRHHDFRPFAVWRIALGLAILRWLPALP